MKSRVFLTAAAGLVCVQALAAQPATTPARPAAVPAKPAAAATGPWAKVPALPTACYYGPDQWSEQNDAAISALQDTKEAQESKNSELEEQLSAGMGSAENPWAMAQAMAKDPANAQKLLESMNQTGQQTGAETLQKQEKEKLLENESKALLKQYDAALEKAMGPAQARWNAWQKKMGWKVEPGFAMMPDPSWPPSAWQEWAAVQKDRDAAYVANCAQWWTASGPVHAFMNRYKTYLVQERIPYYKKNFDEVTLKQFKLLGVPADGYRTTADYEAAIDYMKMASTLFGHRQYSPLSERFP